MDGGPTIEYRRDGTSEETGGLVYTQEVDMKGLALALLATLLFGASGSAVEEARPKAKAPQTIYVPIIRTEGLSRQERVVMTELLIKSIEHSTSLKVVGSPDDADLIFEGNVRPAK